MKFKNIKVGDKVRCIRTCNCCVLNGEIYTVVEAQPQVGSDLVAFRPEGRMANGAIRKGPMLGGNEVLEYFEKVDLSSEETYNRLMSDAV